MSSTPGSTEDRRAFPRGSGACELVYRGQTFKLADWSAGGCAVPGRLPDVEQDTTKEIELIITGPSTRIFQKLKARVVRVEQGTTALVFMDTEEGVHDLLLAAQNAFSKNLFVLDEKDDGIPL